MPLPTALKDEETALTLWLTHYLSETFFESKKRQFGNRKCLKGGVQGRMTGKRKGGSPSFGSVLARKVSARDGLISVLEPLVGGVGWVGGISLPTATLVPLS